MASLNKVILLGNLTRDPELKKSQSGISVARLRIAVNEVYRDRQTNQNKEVVCYVDVNVWDRQAESCGQYLTRGSQILVEGRLIYDEWKTPQGEQRNRISVRADRVQFINTTKRPEASASAPQPAPAEAPRPAPPPPPAAPAAPDFSDDPPF